MADRRLTKSQLMDEKERFKQRALDNKVIFVNQVLGKPCEYFQEQMLLHPLYPREDVNLNMVLLPRGSGKSEWGTSADAIHEICVNPNIRCQFIAESQDTAVLFLSDAKGHFEENDTLRYFFGDHVSSKWSSTKIVSSQRTRVIKEPTIECLGAGGALVGRRSDLQYVDDVVSDRTSRTPNEREKLYRWYDKTVKPMLVRGATQKMRGTRWYPGDLWEQLIRRYGEEVLFRQKALLDINEDTWDSYSPIEGDMFLLQDQTLYRSFFPLLFTVPGLLARRAANPVEFASQYQNEVKLMLSNIIDYESLIVIDDEKFPDFAEMLFYIGVDPSTGTKANSDYFSITVIGLHAPTGLLYIWRNWASRKVKDPKAMMDVIAKHWWDIKSRGGDVAQIGIETNAFQNVLVNAFYAEPELYGMLPVTRVNTVKDKQTRFVAEAHWFNLSRVRFSETCVKLIEDLVSFPDLDNDDRVDSTLIALQLIGRSGLVSAGFKQPLIDLYKDSAIAF